MLLKAHNSTKESRLFSRKQASKQFIVQHQQGGSMRWCSSGGAYVIEWKCNGCWCRAVRDWRCRKLICNEISKRCVVKDGNDYTCRYAYTHTHTYKPTNKDMCLCNKFFVQRCKHVSEYKLLLRRLVCVCVAQLNVREWEFTRNCSDLLHNERQYKFKFAQ